MMAVRVHGIGILIAGAGLALAILCAASAHGAQSTRLSQSQTTPSPDTPVAAVVEWDEVREDALETRRLSRLAVRRAPTPALPRNVEPGQWIETEVPILTPTYEALGFQSQPDVLLYPRGDFYTLVVQSEDLVVEVFCTRLAHSRPDSRTERYLRGAGPEGYRTTLTRSGRELFFNRYNVAYSITLECYDPERDPRCAAPDYGERLMQSLQILPGTRSGEGAQ